MLILFIDSFAFVCYNKIAEYIFIIIDSYLFLQKNTAQNKSSYKL